MIGPGATFAPGTPSVPGTSTAIVGNLKFGPGAIYAVNLDPAASTFAKVTGAASLTGAIVDSQFTLGSYMPKTYTILTTAGGLGGTTFAGLTSINLPASFAESLSYRANDVYLNLSSRFYLLHRPDDQSTECSQHTDQLLQHNWRHSISVRYCYSRRTHAIGR